MEQSYAGHEEFDAIKNQLAALMQGNLPAIPLWLKPDSFRRLYGPAEARPFQRLGSFRKL
jgi:hypothetical protein